MKPLDIESIRIKNIHYALTNVFDANGHVALSPTEFPSINKAKAHSRKLGGMNTVRAFRSKDEAYDFLRAYEKDLKEEAKDIAKDNMPGQAEEFAMAAEAEESSPA